MALGIVFADIIGAVATWLEDDVRLTAAVYTGQHFNKPDYPYATISVLSGPSIAGMGPMRSWSYQVGPDNINIDYQSMGEMSFSLQFLSNDPTIHAMELAYYAFESIHTATISSALSETANLGFLGVDPIENLDFVDSDQLISRSGFTARFSIGLGFAETVDTIESVIITEALDNEDDSALPGKDLTIP